MLNTLTTDQKAAATDARTQILAIRKLLIALGELVAYAGLDTVLVDRVHYSLTDVSKEVESALADRG